MVYDIPADPEWDLQALLAKVSMTMLIWNDLMNSQHDNLSRGSPRLMTSDRQILYPHIPLSIFAFVTARFAGMDRERGRLPGSRWVLRQFGL